MPISRQNSPFPVVSFVTIVLTCIGIVVVLLKPLIPPLPENQLITFDEDFLLSAKHQDIDWLNFAPSSFARARREDKPILLVYGDRCNQTARIADDIVFTDSDVIDILARYFLCIRVDASQYPELRSSFLPLSRVNVGPEPLFQMWLLGPSGELFFMPGLRPIGMPFNNYWALAFLRSGLNQFSSIRSAVTPSTLGDLQSNDLALLFGESSVETDYSGCLGSISEKVDQVFGGYKITSQQVLRPSAIKYLQRVGSERLIGRIVDPLIRSRMIDWLDGGFFHASDEKWQSVEYDKLAAQNAEMMAVMAGLYCQYGDPVYKYLAISTFDALQKSFHERGLIYSYRIGHVDALKRSPRASFSPIELRRSFVPEERVWLRRNFGLQNASNPQMNVTLSEPGIVVSQPESVQGYLARLRSIKKDSPVEYGGVGECNVSGTVVARMLETARLLKDKDRLEQASIMFDELRIFRSGKDDVFHSVRKGSQSRSVLADYLGYADAALQEYLCFGRLVSLDDGFQVLQRGLFLFSGEQAGDIRDGSIPADPAWPKNLIAVQLLDELGESNVAKAVRLCTSYSFLYRSFQREDEAGKVGLSLFQTAQSIVERFNIAAKNVASEAAGFFYAASVAQDDTFVITVGPEAQELANQIAPLAPLTTVAPAFGKIRPMMQSFPPGAYIISAGSRIGPLSADQCAARIRKMMTARP